MLVDLDPSLALEVIIVLESIYLPVHPLLDGDDHNVLSALALLRGAPLKGDIVGAQRGLEACDLVQDQVVFRARLHEPNVKLFSLLLGQIPIPLDVAFKDRSLVKNEFWGSLGTVGLRIIINRSQIA